MKVSKKFADGVEGEPKSHQLLAAEKIGKLDDAALVQVLVVVVEACRHLIEPGR